MSTGSPNPLPLDSRERDLLQARFSEAVFLIAIGLREREDAYDLGTNGDRHPFSPNLRSGIQMFAALHLQHAATREAALEVLTGLSESRFIRTHSTRDLASWVDTWTPDAKGALHGNPCLELGPLVAVSGAYFSVTDDCEDLLALNKNRNLDCFREFQVYRHLKSRDQAHYVFGRALIISHPILSYEEQSAVLTGRFDALDMSPLGEKPSRDINLEWVEQLIHLAYDTVPPNVRICPHCRWTMSLDALQIRCASPACANHVTRRSFAGLPRPPHDALRLHRGVMRYIAAPGSLELAVARQARSLGFDIEVWPAFDTCDVLIRLPDGKTIAADAKVYARPRTLAAAITRDTMRRTLGADKALYVVPNDTPQTFIRAVNKRIFHIHDTSCLNLIELTNMLKQAKEAAK